MIFGAVPLLYDAGHILHAPLNEFEQGKIIPYQETPERIDATYQHLLSRGLGQVVRSAGAASIDDLVSIHDLQMLDFMEAVSHSIHDENQYIYPEFFPARSGMDAHPKSMAGRLGRYATDIYSPIGMGTWQAALRAAGLALQGAEMLLRQDASAVYAMTRPPGHHAGPDFFGSYCYVNHAALAASRLMSHGRVAILDIDYHHGNGTQAIFWDEPRVLYASLHIDPNFDFPYFTGFAHETGGVRAPGSTFNLPLPPGTPSATYLAALDALINAVRAFRPGSLVVSLGYDPFSGDPLSAFRLESSVYTAIGGLIAAMHLPTLIIQEGGYALEMLPALAQNFVAGFLAGMLLK